jgi:hypothetical protein
MNDQDWLAERLEADRPHLRGVAFRMLGSLTEADDAVVARRIPFGTRFIRVLDGVDLDHPSDAAEGRPVFELHPAPMTSDA